MAVGRQYKMADKIRIGIFMLANIFFYLTAFTLLFIQADYFWTGILIGLRCVVIYSVYKLISQKLNEKLSVILLPLLDLAYFFNYLVLGFSILMFNKVRWK
jgi:tryptophan-rich sensory protein